MKLLEHILDLVGKLILFFGATNVVHEHFASMGFDATVLDRVDYTIKSKKKKKIVKIIKLINYKLKDKYEDDKTLEFVWQPSHSLE
jgi:hypothetical protein